MAGPEIDEVVQEPHANALSRALHDFGSLDEAEKMAVFSNLPDEIKSRLTAFLSNTGTDATCHWKCSTKNHGRFP